MRREKGITLISLVITIIILIILSSIAIYLSLGNNGIFTRAKEVKESTNKQEATEIINLKITNCQINKYAERQEMPTLQELADVLYEDNEIEYIALETKVGTKEKITVGEKTSIFTKLNEYPYEFEINSSLQLASIDGVKIASSNINELEKRISNLEAQITELKTIRKATITKSNDVKELKVHSFCYKNNSAKLSISVKLKSNLNSGESVLVGNINEEEARPLNTSSMGIGYYGSSIFVLTIKTNGNIEIRNASTSNLSSTSTDKASLGLHIYYPLFN